MSDTLSICVLTYNQWRELLPDCLASIEAQDFEIDTPVDCVVVDNGADPPVDERIFPHRRWRKIRILRNRGHIAGINTCFANAKTRYVLFVSDDVRFKSDAIRGLLHAAQYFPNAPCIQPMIENADGTIQNAGMDYRWPGYGIGRYRFRHQHTWIVPSITFLLARVTWNNLGGFDESLGAAYEDVDFGLRLRARGLFSVVNPNSVAIHLANQTLKHTLPNHRQQFHDARLKVIDKHYGGLDRWLRRTAVNIIDGIRRLF